MGFALKSMAIICICSIKSLLIEMFYIKSFSMNRAITSAFDKEILKTIFIIDAAFARIKYAAQLFLTKLNWCNYCLLAMLVNFGIYHS